MQQVDNLLSVKDIASYLGVSKQSLYRMVKASAIPAYKVRGSWRFRLSQVGEFLSSTSVVPPTCEVERVDLHNLLRPERRTFQG
jgi:excisionase family DNA binding protein